MTGNERRVLKPGWESTRSRHEKGTRGTLPKVSTPRAHVTYIAQWEKNQNSRDHGRGSWRPSLLVLRILQITPSLAPYPASAMAKHWHSKLHSPFFDGG